LGLREVKKFSELSNVTPNNFVIEYLREFEFFSKTFSLRISALGKKEKAKNSGQKSGDTAPLN